METSTKRSPTGQEYVRIITASQGQSTASSNNQKPDEVVTVTREGRKEGEEQKWHDTAYHYKNPESKKQTYDHSGNFGKTNESNNSFNSNTLHVLDSSDTNTHLHDNSLNSKYL